MIHRTVTRYAGSYNARISLNPYIQRSVRFQYSQTFLDPFVAPNKIITHFLLIAVVPEILTDIVRRVADDNIGGVGFDRLYQRYSLRCILLISISAVSPPSPSPSLPQQTGVGGGRNHFINEFLVLDRRFDVILITQPTLSCFTFVFRSPCSSHFIKVRSLSLISPSLFRQVYFKKEYNIC
jgi:hypothetical protein